MTTTASPDRRWLLCGLVRGAIVAALLIAISGCRINDLATARRAATVLSYGVPAEVQVKPVRHWPKVNSISRLFARPQPPSGRTQQLLRSYNLLEEYQRRPADVIEQLQRVVLHLPRMEEVHALAEVAKIQADWRAKNGDQDDAMKLYATAISHAHRFLFDNQLELQRNAYDPQFRNICDIYNGSLESMMRSLCSNNLLANGQRIEIGDQDLGLDLTVQLEGRWRDRKFERFELVGDYQTQGIENQHHTYGLGVPLIAVLQSDQNFFDQKENYYPPSLALPMTAFCEIIPRAQGEVSMRRTAVLRLLDPLEQKTVQHSGRTVPLESDLTTPLAYHLQDPLLHQSVLATATLLSSNLADKVHGMYMLEPFDPNKIPVVMVHGLWSSPVTWTQMFNDLRAIPEINANYQFWFYSYNTGQPFIISAKQMREDLRRLRDNFDPERSLPTLDQMVVVAHSMGGLVSRLQVVDSGQAFWDAMGAGDFDRLEGDPEVIQRLRQTIFFQRNPAIKRVVTIATPHHGSRSATVPAQWLGQKIISLPEFVTHEINELSRRNPGSIEHPELITGTSIDALSPSAPIFPAMNQLTPPTEVKFHNIIGRLEKKSLLSLRIDPADPGSDGVVSVESAKFPRASTQAFVPEEHSDVHTHPRSILEVKRVLIEHLVQQNRLRENAIPIVPGGQEESWPPVPKESGSPWTALWSENFSDHSDSAGEKSPVRFNRTADSRWEHPQ